MIILDEFTSELGLEPHEVQKIFYEEIQNPELDSKGKNLIAAYFYAQRALTR